MVRTTLDIDDVILSAARNKASAEGISVGRALSDLARAGLRGQPVAPVAGFPILRGVPGHLVTDEMVATALDDD